MTMRATRPDLQSDSTSCLSEDQDHLCDEQVPRVLGGVRLARILGEGGMGRVYLGYHPILDVDVAVKVMLDRSSDRSRFLTEARLAAPRFG